MQLKDYLMMIGGEGYVHIRTEHSVTKKIEEFNIKPSLYSNESLEDQFRQYSLDNQANVWIQMGAPANDKQKRPMVANVVWADLDTYKYPGGEAQALELLKKLPEPTLLVRSGSGLHVYWKLSEAVSALGLDSPAQRLAKSVQWLLGGDAAHSPSKLLRVPTTFNFKPDKYEGGKECYIVAWKDVQYSPKDMPKDAVLDKVGHKTMVKMVLGPDEVVEDRSGWDFGVCLALFNQGLNAEEVSYLMETYKFSGKAADEGSHKRHYVTQTVRQASKRGGKPVESTRIAPVWNPKTLEQILAEEKPPFLIQDFLPQAETAIIAAPPKAGKSYAVLQLAEAVSTGGEWLGMKVQKSVKVGYVQAELPNWMIADRMSLMYPGEKLPNIHFYHQTGVNLLLEEDIESLVRIVEENEYGLLIIDPVANFWLGDENSSSSVNKLFDNLTDIQKLGCAVLLVHHTKKLEANTRITPQDQRGSNVFFARPAAIMTLSPIEQVGALPFTWADFSLRAAAPKEALRLFKADNGSFTLTQPSLGTTQSPVYQRMVELTQKKTKQAVDTPPWEDDNDGVITYALRGD